MLATRLRLTLARGLFFVFASFGLLLGGGIILVAANSIPLRALDNGQRSPRKLLRAAVARLLGRRP